MRKKWSVLFILSLLLVCLVRCTKTDARAAGQGFTALPATILTPADNPQTTDKIYLGKLLFWDPILSGKKDISCATCHHASLGYSDNLDLAIGSNGTGFGSARHFSFPNDIAFTKRNTPTIINVAFNGMDVNGKYDPSTAVMFFDNRVKSLELQSVEPIKTLEEMMGHSYSAAAALDSVITRLKSNDRYIQLFEKAFGDGTVTVARLEKALASFERTIISNHSPFDKYMNGDLTAMTSVQIQGMNAFKDNGCNNCHHGPMFSDFQVHILSVPDNPKLPTDAGAGGSYSFRTPGLRNVALTAPFMHNGVFNSLNQVLDFYENVGHGDSQNPHVAKNKLDGNLRRINDRDKNLIIQFLNALNDNSFDKTIPSTVPSGLKVGGNL